MAKKVATHKEKPVKKFNRPFFGAPMFLPFRPNELWTDLQWTDYIQETLQSLKVENEREKNDTHFMQNVISYEVGFELIWSAADVFGLENESRYIAVDLFSRFIEKHAASLMEYVMTKTKGESGREKMMRELERRVKAQAPLRALTCLMIASKLCSHQNAVDATSLRDFMKTLSMNFNVKQIVRSEIRVLEQLEYKCLHTNPLTVYVGVLVSATLGLWSSKISREVKQVQYEDLYKASMNLLTVAFLKHEQLYEELFFLVTGSRVIPKELWPAWSRVVADRFLLAASVIAAGGWTLGGDALCKMIIMGIATNIHLHAEDLESLTACVLHISDLSPEPASQEQDIAKTRGKRRKCQRGDKKSGHVSS